MGSFSAYSVLSDKKSVAETPPKKPKTSYKPWLYVIYFTVLIVVFSIGVHFRLFNIIYHVPHERTDSTEGSPWRYVDLFRSKNWSLRNPPGTEVKWRSEQQVQVEGFRIVCYYVISSTTAADLQPEQIDPYLCTHIIIGFSSLSNGTVQRMERIPSFEKIFEKVLKLKKIQPSLKVLLSVAEMASSGQFSLMVSSDTSRHKFVNDTFKYLKRFGFDGIDLDWEFPSWPADNLVQVRNFTTLLASLRKAADREKMVVSAAVAAPALIMQQSYEIEEMSKYVDFVNVMCYDYHMYSDFIPLTGPNAPLYPHPSETGFLKTLNTNWSSVNWVHWGMPSSKVNVGIPTYGHSYRLTNEDNSGWNAPASGYGSLGQQGFITYPDSCGFISNPQTIKVNDGDYRVPYAYKGHEWISYENEMSIELKAIFIKEKRFGGAMIYSLNSDDFSSKCKGRPFALTRKVNDILTEVS